MHRVLISTCGNCLRIPSTKNDGKSDSLLSLCNYLQADCLTAKCFHQAWGYQIKFFISEVAKKNAQSLFPKKNSSVMSFAS